MSVAEATTEEIIPPLEIWDVNSSGPAVFTLPLSLNFSALLDDTTIEQADITIDRIKAGARASAPPPKAAFLEGLADEVKAAYHAGEFTWREAPAALDWIWYDRHISVITEHDLRDGFFKTLLLAYAEEHGYKAPAGTKRYHYPIGNRPTHIEREASQSAKRLPKSQISMPGFTKAQVASIRSVVDRATGSLVAWVTDLMERMLPGMAPGQVPEALSHQNTAITILERQVTQLRQHPAVRQSPALRQQVSALSEQVGQLNQALTAQQETTGSAITGIEGTLGALGAEVIAIKGIEEGFQRTAIERMDNFEHQFAGTKPSIIYEELKGVAGTANHAQTLAQEALQKLDNVPKTCLDTLCEDQANVINPIKAGGATPSLLHQLGNILKSLLGIGFVLEAVNTLLTILDARVTLRDVAADTEWLASVAVTAATTISADLDMWAVPAHA